MFRSFVVALLFASTMASIRAAECTGNEESVSVEGIGDFCAVGPVCSGGNPTGACPGVTAGLEFGSHCGTVASGVAGCVANAGPASPVVDPPTPVVDPIPTEPQPPVVDPVVVVDPISTEPQPSVVDPVVVVDPIPIEPQPPVVDPVVVVDPIPTEPVVDPVVVVDPIPTEPQPPVVVVDPVPTEPQPPVSPVSSECIEVSVEGVEGKFCTEGPVCSGADDSGKCPGPQEGLPQGAVCGQVASGVFGCKPNRPIAVNPVPAAPQAPPSIYCGANEVEMSVEYAEGVFCMSAAAPACSGDLLIGECPGPQEGLPNGAECGVVASGVFGCKAVGGAGGAPPAPVNGGEAPFSCAGNPGGNTPVSVVGAGTYCAQQPVCAGAIFGNCPTEASGLSTPTECAYIHPGVYGCRTVSATP